MADGWIKVYRELLSKTIWTNSTPEQKVILISLLLMANHNVAEWDWNGERFKVQKGEFITSLESIRKSAGKKISIQQIRTALDRFKTLEFLTYKSTKQGRMITILNYEQYQSTPIPKQQSKQQIDNKQVTTNKNDKKERIYNTYTKTIKPKGKSRNRALKNIAKHLKKYSEESLIHSIKNYHSTIINSFGNFDREPQYRKDPANFFGVNEQPFLDFLPENFEIEPSQQVATL